MPDGSIEAVGQVLRGAARAQDADWRRVLRLYDDLLAALPTPVVTLNRAAALVRLGRPDEAVALSADSLPTRGWAPRC